jgi:hypothetical protein
MKPLPDCSKKAERLERRGKPMPFERPERRQLTSSGEGGGTGDPAVMANRSLARIRLFKRKSGRTGATAIALHRSAD